MHSNAHEFIVVTGESARCYVCRDVFGAPTLLGRRNVKRHMNSSTHIAGLAKSKGKKLIPTPSSLPHASAPPSIAHNPTPTHGPTSDFQHPDWPTVSTDGLEDFAAGGVTGPTENSFCAEEEDGDTNSSSSSDFDAEDVEDYFVRSQDNQAQDSQAPPPDDESDSDSSESASESGSDEDVIQPTGSTRSIMNLPTKPSVWSPFPTKAMYLADALGNSRRVHFGRRHIEAALEFARETKGEDIPSYSALRQFQKKLKAKVGDPSQRCVSSTGTIYHVNRISEGIKQDMANPLVRPHMNFLPHAEGNRLSQAWNGHKMVHDIPDHILTPCVRIGGKMFYVNELVRRKHDWFIPLRWVTCGENRELHAVGHIVKDTLAGLNVLDTDRKTVRAATFLESFCDLQARKGVPHFNEESQRFQPMMPHPLRSTAGARAVYSVPLIVFMDDASGNVSKQWNKHWSCYLSNATLPREVLQSEYYVRFVSTSPHASPSELTQGIRASIEEAFNNPVIAFDCVTGEEVLVRPFALFWAGDNPMQAEHCSSSGLNSNHFCRTCDVGGSDEHKQSLIGYQSLFKPGKKRIASETRLLVDERLDMALKPKMIQKIKDRARDTGVKDSMAQPLVENLLDLGKQLRKPTAGAPRRSPDEIERILQAALDDARRDCYMNPLLDMDGVDIHRDTPTELLHTVLLGVVKYYWAQSVFVLEKAKKLSLLESRLASINIGGLDLPKIPASYMCQYRGSLIGKHFKTIVQVMAFVSHDLLPAQLLNAWLLMGRLTSLLWYTTINDVKAYTEELEGLINDFLLTTAQCSPSIIVLKPKFHFLVHLPSYIRRFGPALLFSTERFESFNGVFRAASTFSNRQAPSRDIARRFGDLERIKHVTSGGYWREGNTWVRASDTLLDFTATNKVFNRLIGFPLRKTSVPGSVVLLPKVSKTSLIRATPQLWAKFSTNIAFSNCPPPFNSPASYFHVLSTVSQSGDTIKVGSDIICTGNSFGHVQAIFGCLSADNNCSYFVAIRVYTLGHEKHPIFDMPMASRSNAIVCVAVTDIMCPVNMQHDCTGACSNTRTVHEIHEHEQTTKVRYRVEHADSTRFVINLHGLHNAQLVRHALPCDLYARHAETSDPEEIFRSAVEKLSISKLQKARLAAAKKQAKGIVAEAIETSIEDTEANDEVPGGEDEVELDVTVLGSNRGRKRKSAGTRGTRKRSNRGGRNGA